MIHHIIGKLLQGRYQIVQSLGAGVFGQTYIALDVDYPDNPKCVVKLIKASSFESNYLDTLRLLFLTETETLKLLGSHPQIPEFIACFEENKRFYLVQEYIEGHALTAELPIIQNWGCLWSESEVVEFLLDVLGILEFIHSQGVIHCDIKPENLIRRASDNKLVLIDFGSIQSINFGIGAELPIHKIPVTSLGYIPPEQFIGETQPNSDIYALGMIAIQALTGLEPLQLKVDPYTNEIIWRSSSTPVNDYLAAVLSQMIRYNYQDRFQSATEVLRVLQQMKWETQSSEISTVDDDFLAEPTSEDATYENSTSLKLSPLWTGMKVGLAANSLLMGFGVYSLINNSPAYSETETLSQAKKEYQAGDLEEAIALVKSIPSQSNIYPEAQATIEEWQQQWQVAAQQYQIALTAYHESRWSDVIDAARLTPNILYWQSKTDKLIEQAYIKIQAQTEDLLAKAYDSASIKDFSAALRYLRQIPKESSAGAIVQDKLAEYNRKRQIRAAYFLNKAYYQASIGEFDRAVKLLKNIPNDTLVYSEAQIKLNEYTRKQRFIAQNSQLASVKRESSRKIRYFKIENQLQELNIQ
ncbi:MAG: serine/threonine-protein kinase [Nostoc sp. ChiSLP02]|nr:serine/threonine-protein kinase [Nostoc sp. DedSLP05]MDZ8100962.1 serine/threonine-protein kinase [Nostoc sp. DedSLP01]MDZ8189482.1 serine/threonine-protein kinase [Nostoc sp. ChiSLP02]